QPAKTSVPPRRGRRHWLRSRRGLATIALAALASGAGLVAYQLSRSGELSVIANRAGHLLVEESARWGLGVADIEVEGRGMTTPEAILGALGAQRGTPILAVSPASAKAQLEALPWVRSAVVERQLPDTLRITLSERKPLAFWQRQSKLVLIDRDG